MTSTIYKRCHFSIKEANPYKLYKTISLAPFQRKGNVKRNFKILYAPFICLGEKWKMIQTMVSGKNTAIRSRISTPFK